MLHFVEGSLTRTGTLADPKKGGLPVTLRASSFEIATGNGIDFGLK